MEARSSGPRACTICAKAKAKCVPSATSLKCERCIRLGKPCSQQIPAPPRARKPRRVTRIAQLEQKLVELTSRITIPEDQPAEVPNAEKRPKRYGLSFNYLFPGDNLSDEEDQPVNRTPDRQGEATLSPPDEESPPRQPVTAWPELEEAEMLLREYRLKMMPVFPFVIIPTGMTAAQLQAQRPFTWKGVMLEACRLDGNRQVCLGKELLKEFSEALLMQPRKSLDLLQGLLLYITWYHYGLHSFQLTNLLGLLRSLCLSLGFSESQLGSKQPGRSQLCLESMRAYAGTYYLVTSVYTTSKRHDALMHTTYLSTLCHVLQDQAEYPTDELLVSLVRVQQVAQVICTTFPANNTSLQLSAIPTAMMVKGLQAQIHTLERSFSAELRSHIGLMAHVRIAECLLFEVSLRDVQGGISTLQSAERLEMLEALLSALKGFLALRFQKSMAEWPRFPCISSVDFMYAFITCLKLITLQTPGWDLVSIRQDLALDTLLARQIEDMEVLIRLRKLRQDNRITTVSVEDPWERMTALLKVVHAVLKAMPEPATTNPTVVQTVTPPTITDAMFDLGTQSALSNDALQEIWGDSIYDFGDWNSNSHFPFV